MSMNDRGTIYPGPPDKPWDGLTKRKTYHDSLDYQKPLTRWLPIPAPDPLLTATYERIDTLREALKESLGVPKQLIAPQIRSEMQRLVVNNPPSVMMPGYTKTQWFLQREPEKNWLAPPQTNPLYDAKIRFGFGLPLYRGMPQGITDPPTSYRRSINTIVRHMEIRIDIMKNVTLKSFVKKRAKGFANLVDDLLFN